MGNHVCSQLYNQLLESVEKKKTKQGWICEVEDKESLCKPE